MKTALSIRIASITILCSLAMPLTVLAHGGGLDSHDCHYCRTNCEAKGAVTGEYHCHAGGDKSVYTAVPNNNEEEDMEVVETPEEEPIATITTEDSIEIETQVDEPVQDTVLKEEKQSAVKVSTFIEEVEPLPVYPQDNAVVDPIVIEQEVAVQEEVKHIPEKGDTVEIEESIIGKKEVIEDENVPPLTAGENALGYAILAGMGYGGYKGVQKIKKIVIKKDAK